MKHTNFPSRYNIDDKVAFIPMYRHCKKLGIKKDESRGMIIAVRFTKTKVFYDILCEYYGIIFDNVDSSNIIEQKKKGKK